MNHTAIKKFFSERKLNIAISVLAFAAMWLVWLIAYYAVANDYLVPSLSDTLKSFGGCLAEGGFWLSFSKTLLRGLLSLVVSLCLAAALVCSGIACRWIRGFVKPFITVLRTLPTLAIILILLFWTTPSVAPAVVTVLVLFPMFYLQISTAVNGIDPQIIEMAKVYNIPLSARLGKIYLPQISPAILSQTGANFSLGIKITVSAEVLAGTFGSLGGMMQNARFYVDMPRLAALTVVAVLTGIIIEMIFNIITCVCFRWRRSK